jgi:NAD(P)-dependent dehydrogenase (short-subunit alcohol dehydrogenase family)
MTRAVLPGMRARHRGVILNVASVAGIVGGVSGAAYTASKHAVIGLTRNVAVTYGPQGIRCNSICPGGIDSGMPIATSTGPTDATDPVLDARVARIRSTQPRRGLPSEISSVAVFLASEGASFVNGATIVVDGGWTSSGLV